MAGCDRPHLQRSAVDVVPAVWMEQPDRPLADDRDQGGHVKPHARFALVGVTHLRSTGSDCGH
jgi:hypothetical protein